MRPRPCASKRFVLAVASAILAGLLAGGANAGPLLTGQVALGDAAAGALLSYQGRLLDPATRSPKPDGTYSMVFSLYNVEAGGMALWSETKAVSIKGGLFSTLLGEQLALPDSIFNGQALWLGIRVGGTEPEAAPRQRVGYGAYAMFARNSDLLDGRQAAFYQSATNINAGTLATDRYSAAADLRAETMIGPAAGQVAAGDHLHDTRYYTKALADDRYVNAVGDTMSGDLTVGRVLYRPAKVEYYAVSGEAFLPAFNTAYANSGDTGGAYLVSGGGALTAAIHLPQGASITELTVHVFDNSASNLVVVLDRMPLPGGGYAEMARVESAGTPRYTSLSDSSIDLNPVDNSSGALLIYAYSNAWDGTNLRLMGVTITYTIPEAH